jgi:hypothetical protein
MAVNARSGANKTSCRPMVSPECSVRNGLMPTGGASTWHHHHPVFTEAKQSMSVLRSAGKWGGRRRLLAYMVQVDSALGQEVQVLDLLVLQKQGILGLTSGSTTGVRRYMQGMD